MSYYFEKLTDEYAGWQAANKLQLGAAEDHLKDPNLTPDQRQWLYLFAWRWQLTEAHLEAS